MFMLKTMGFKLISLALPCKSAHTGEFLESRLTGEIPVPFHLFRSPYSLPAAPVTAEGRGKLNAAPAEPLKPQDYPLERSTVLIQLLTNRKACTTRPSLHI